MNAKSLGAVLVLVGLVGATACDAPTSPTRPTPMSTPTPTPTPAPGEIPTRLTITRITSAAGGASWAKWFGMVPGETATFTATATFADGTEHDVTATAAWETNMTSVAVVVSRGVVRAEIPGWSTVDVVYRWGNRSLSASALLRVAPPGVFLLDFSVNDGRWEIPGSVVRVVSSAGTFSTATIAVAPVSLPAVGDTVVEVAAGAGVPAWIRSSLTVTCDTFADCNTAAGSCRFSTCEK